MYDNEFRTLEKIRTKQEDRTIALKATSTRVVSAFKHFNFVTTSTFVVNLVKPSQTSSTLSKSTLVTVLGLALFSC